MRRVSANVYTEVYFTGCNPSFLVTSNGVLMVDTPQQPIDAVRWRETLEAHGPIRQLVNTEPHIDHISGNVYYPGVEVIGQVGLKQRYEQDFPMLSAPQRGEAMKQEDPDSVFLFNHPDYPANPPTRTFDDRLSFQLGDHEVQLIHMPGHTAPQTSVYLPQEGVVCTGDTVFNATKTWLHDADPWQWLQALDQLEALDVGVIVPGHGEPCDKRYLKTQAQVIHNWLGVVEGLVRRGLTEDEAVKQPLDRRELDPYPPGQRLHAWEDRIHDWSLRNLYKRVAARLAQTA
jgi:cyclase